MDVGALLSEPYTSDPDRRRTYPDDISFREMAFRLGTMPPEVRARLLERVSFLMLKPEAVVGRRVAPALSFLGENGFAPLGGLLVQVGPGTHRELWRYQLNAAPLAIIRTVDLILAAGPCLFVAVADTLGPETTGMTAARRLGELKGSTRDRRNGAGSLRDALGCTLLCLNFVHTPDEPADMIREVGVLFPGRRREEALALLTGGERSGPGGHDLTTLTAQLYAAHPAHLLDAASAVSALRESAPAAADAVVGADPMAALDVLEDERLPLPLWDRITVAAGLVDRLESGLLPLIGPPPGERADRRRSSAAERVSADGGVGRSIQ